VIRRRSPQNVPTLGENHGDEIRLSQNNVGSFIFPTEHNVEGRMASFYTSLVFTWWLIMFSHAHKKLGGLVVFFLKR